MFRPTQILPRKDEFFQKFTTPIPARATRTHRARDEDEISLQAGERLSLSERKGEWWYIGQTSVGFEGWIPAEYVQLLGTVEAKNAEAYQEWRERVEAIMSVGPGTMIQNSSLGVPTVQHGTDGEAEGGVSLFPKPTPIATKTVAHTGPVKITSETFPYLPSSASKCSLPSCLARKEATGLGACVHDIEALLRDGLDDEYDVQWLSRERRRWHPDRLLRRVAPRGWKGQAKVLIEEVFVILGELLDKERDRKKGEREGDGFA